LRLVRGQWKLAGAVALVLLDRYGADPTIFLLTTALLFLVFGEIYSLFPATCGDMFGAASTNAGLLHTAKGTASRLVPLAGTLAAASGGHAVFMLGTTFSLLAAARGLVVVRPMRRDFSLRLSPCHAGRQFRNLRYWPTKSQPTSFE
jgi:OFA family oxalate/formate antiporter-like MFS transporter